MADDVTAHEDHELTTLKLKSSVRYTNCYKKAISFTLD